MPKYSVKLEDGRTAQIETDSPVESNEQMQQIIAQQMGGGVSDDSGLRTKAKPEEYMTSGERFRGGFDPKLEEKLEVRRAEAGLAPGTPLEPIGFNWENFKDLPNDVLDSIGPAFPLVGQLIGGALGGASALIAGQLGPQIATPEEIVTVPAAAIAFGGAGSAFGEMVRQGIGEYLLGIEQGTISERGGRVLLEGVMGAGGEALGLGINLALKSTKSGLLKAANNLLKTKNVDSITTGLARIFKSANTPAFANKIQFALDSLRGKVTGAVDKSVISKTFSNPKFASQFVDDLIKGNSDDFLKTMHMRGRPLNQRGAFRDFYKQFFDIEDDVFNTVVARGPKAVKNISDFNAIKNAAGRIERQLPNMFKKLGGQLTVARARIENRADDVPGVTDTVKKLIATNNVNLAEKLADTQLLLREANGLYSFNPDFIRTSTGRNQTNIFKNFIVDFFEPTDDVTKAAFGKIRNLTIDNPEDLIKLVSGNRKALMSPSKNITYKKFSQSLRKLDKQISGKEFSSVGDLSPQLAQYVKGLRDVTAAVGDAMGDSRASALARSYGQLAMIADDFRGKDKVAIEKIFTRMSGGVKGSAEEAQNKALNNWIKQNFGTDVNNTINLFKANQKISEINRTFGDLKGTKKITNLMKSAFDEGNVSVISRLEDGVDQFLPDNLKIGLNAKRHSVAEMINNDAISLLRGRFLGNALPIQQLAAPAFGAISGGALGGKEGALLGLGGGLAVQNPAVLRALLQSSAKLGGKQIPATAAKQLPKASGALISELLRQGNRSSER